jgi:hypothetical protein
MRYMPNEMDDETMRGTKVFFIVVRNNPLPSKEVFLKIVS